MYCTFTSFGLACLGGPSPALVVAPGGIRASKLAGSGDGIPPRHLRRGASAPAFAAGLELATPAPVVSAERDRQTPYVVVTPGLAGLGIFWLIPIAVSAAISAAASGAQYKIAKNRAAGALKVGATKIAEDVDYQLRKNLEAWNSSAKTVSDQKAALATFDGLWEYMVSPQGCGSPDLGEAGRRCISDREPGAGARNGWDWRQYYRDPIANDPAVVADPPGLFSSLPSASAVLLSESGGLADWILPASLLLGAVLL